MVPDPPSDASTGGPPDDGARASPGIPKDDAFHLLQNDAGPAGRGVAGVLWSPVDG